MAVVTSSLVSALRVGFQREFQDALSSAPSQWDRLSTRVPSSSAGNTYGWIGQFPKLREWSGDRSFKNIKELRLLYRLLRYLPLRHYQP